MKNIVIVSGLVLLSIYAVFKDKEKDPLHKRVFITNVIEIKNGAPSNKSIADELEFKDGRMFSKFLNDKFNISWINYSIQKDTTYIDSVTEANIRYFEVKALYKNEDKEETFVMCKIENENIQGDIKILKNDKLKKQFEFSGTEKATKIKESKK
jgi:hypothetical protein